MLLLDSNNGDLLLHTLIGIGGVLLLLGAVMVINNVSNSGRIPELPSTPEIPMQELDNNIFTDFVVEGHRTFIVPTLINGVPVGGVVEQVIDGQIWFVYYDKFAEIITVTQHFIF